MEEIKKVEEEIKNATTKEEIKTIVRKLFKNLEINDIDFADIIYQDVIPKLLELGVVFGEGKIDYEEVLKEEY